MRMGWLKNDVKKGIDYIDGCSASRGSSRPVEKSCANLLIKQPPVNIKTKNEKMEGFKSDKVKPTNPSFVIVF